MQHHSFSPVCYQANVLLLTPRSKNGRSHFAVSWLTGGKYCFGSCVHIEMSATEKPAAPDRLVASLALAPLGPAVPQATSSPSSRKLLHLLHSDARQAILFFFLAPAGIGPLFVPARTAWRFWMTQNLESLESPNFQPFCLRVKNTR